MTGQLCLKWNNHSEAFNKLLKQIFLEDGAGYSDATILCHGKFYPVHRFVLSTCSEYFEEMFQQCVRLNNKHPFIIVKDIQPEQMEALLNYMYKGEVNVPQEHLPELIKAAEALKIKGLAVPDDDEPPSKKKRSASSSNCSPVPKKSKNKEHYEPSRIKTENESFSSPLVSKIKSEPVDNEPVPEEIPVVENRNIDNNSDLSIDKEEDLYSCEAFTFDSGDQFQEQQESESQWNEEFQSFEEGEGSQEDPSNRTFSKIQNENPMNFSPNCCTLAGCSYTSKHSANLKRHIRSHTGEKPYKCSLCPYRAVQKIHVDQHYLTHVREKPYQCSVCSFRAAQKHVVDRHLQTHIEEKH